MVHADDEALVDCGANGTVGGANVSPLYVSQWTVNVRGINNHEMHNIPIAPVAAHNMVMLLPFFIKLPIVVRDLP